MNNRNEFRRQIYGTDEQWRSAIAQMQTDMEKSDSNSILSLRESMIDMVTADSVEFVIDMTGKIWVNVNGVCRLRIGRAKTVVIDQRSCENPTVLLLMERNG
jgi:hypothetical protein